MFLTLSTRTIIDRILYRLRLNEVKLTHLALGFESNSHWIKTGKNPKEIQGVEEEIDSLDSLEEKLEKFNPDVDSYDFQEFTEKVGESIELLDKVRYILKNGSGQDGVNLNMLVDKLFSNICKRRGKK